MTDEEQEQLVQETATKLAEYFDCVQILCSRHENGETIGYAKGSGNWFARKQMCTDFVDRNKQSDAADFIAQKLKD
jgi:hypothetical protein